MPRLVLPDELVSIDPVAFIQGELRHTKGRFAGQPFRLRGWQRTGIIEPLFSLDPSTGLRRYTQALIGEPRKNGKSEVGAAIGLKLAFADGEYGAEVYGVAGDKDQARIVFNVAKRMVEFSPTLRAHLKLYRDAIVDPGTDSVYRVVSADAPLKHGLNPHGVIFDEVHVQPSRELWDTMTSGSGAREQPLIVGLTTAGYDLSTLCGELYEHGVAVAEDPSIDPRFFFFWIGLDADSEADYRDPETWKIANPALGDFLSLAYLEDECRRLPEAVFRRLHLNQWTAAEQLWIPMEAWDACKAPANIAKTDKVVVGIRTSPRHDESAVVAVAGKDGGWDVDPRVFAPEEDGLVDSDAVESYVLELREAYRIVEVAYNAGQFLERAKSLQRAGLTVGDFPLTPERLAPASQLLYDAVIEGRVRHGGDAELRRHVKAARAKETHRGWQLDPQQPGSAAVLALAIAIVRAMAQEAGAENWLAFAREQLARREQSSEAKV